MVCTTHGYHDLEFSLRLSIEIIGLEITVYTKDLNRNDP